MCYSIAAKGWRPVVLNYRGCAGLQLTSPILYCASFTDDVHVAVEEIHHQFPDAKLFAAGYSLGSLILCKYLAEAANGTWKATGVLLFCLKVPHVCLLYLCCISAILWPLISKLSVAQALSCWLTK